MKEHFEAMIRASVSWLMAFLPSFMPIVVSRMNRRKLVAWLYPEYISPHVRGVVAEEMARVFACMKRYSDATSPKNHLRVVEIGVGSGLNFRYYPKNTYLTTVDHSRECLVDYNENRRLSRPDVTVERTVIAAVEDMADIPGGMADAVVSTYVLCAVEDLATALKEIKRILKPGGCLVFAEHTCYTDCLWKYLLQQVASSFFWPFCGFRTDRDLVAILKEEFEMYDCRVSYHQKLSMPVRPHLTGLAIKWDGDF